MLCSAICLWRYYTKVHEWVMLDILVTFYHTHGDIEDLFLFSWGPHGQERNSQIEQKYCHHVKCSVPTSIPLVSVWPWWPQPHWQCIIIIQLLPCLEGGMKIYSTQKIRVFSDMKIDEFSRLNKSLCLLTNCAINCSLYQKLRKQDVIWRRSMQWDMASGGRHNIWRETRHLEGDTTSGGRHNIWRKTQRLMGDMKICLPPRPLL